MASGTCSFPQEAGAVAPAGVGSDKGAFGDDDGEGNFEVDEDEGALEADAEGEGPFELLAVSLTRKGRNEGHHHFMCFGYTGTLRGHHTTRPTGNHR